VWIPQSYFEDKEVGEGATQGRSWKKRITFASEAINQPIDDSEFTLAALGVKPGDFVTDRRQPESSVSFRYTGEGGMPEEELARFMGALTGDIPDSQPAADGVMAGSGSETAAASDAGPLALSTPTDGRGRAAGTGGLVTIVVLGAVVAGAMIAVVWFIRRTRTEEEQA
jgi:hypothetical protein